MTRKDVRVAVIGTGFMGRAHTNAYRKVGNFFELGHRPVLQAVCARSPGAAEAFAQKWGFASHETDWRRVIERDDIDAVDICTPNDTHREIALAAAAAGKIILCEKPLARTAAEGAEMVAAVEAAGEPYGVYWNAPYVPFFLKRFEVHVPVRPKNP